MHAYIILDVLILCLACSSAFSAEPSREHSLGIEHGSTSKVNFPQAKTLDLGANVKLELVLIPAGEFLMGLSKPNISIESGQVLIAIGLTLMLGLIALHLKRMRFSFSLRWLIMLTLACSIITWGGVRWYQARTQLEEYELIIERSNSETTSASYRSEMAHRVRISKAFYMGKCTVTQEQYETVVGKNPSFFRESKNPVESVSWDDAMAFCKKLNELLREQDLEANLPTEAQWEYACRAGTRTRFHSGNTERDLDMVAWYVENSGRKTHSVAKKLANAFELHDMHGNVWQWCRDAYREDYERLDATDPNYNLPRANRVLRGGCYDNASFFCRSSFRLSDSPGSVGGSIGFRIVLNTLRE